MASKKLINKLDKVFGKFIRQDGKCEWCGSSQGQMQWCHIFSRKFHNTRWNEMNSLCLCARCHRKAHDMPTVFTDWVKDHLGESVYDELLMEHNRTKKWLDYKIEEMIEKYETKNNTR